MDTRAWIAAAVITIATAGCSSGGSNAQGGDESTGRIAASLSSVGPDGATYSLNIAVLNIVPTGDAGTAGGILFDSSTGNQSSSMAVGSYAGTLQGGPLDGAAGWSLIRQFNGATTTVAAALLDPQPYLFTISPGATTNLTLHFEVASVGAISFGSGTLSTNLSVDAGSVPPGHGSIVTTVSFPQETISSGSTALDNLLAIPASGTGSVPFTMKVAFTSPFALGVDQACANITAAISATALPDAGSEDAYAAFLQELDGGTGAVCVSDATSQFGSVLRFLVNRIGTPSTLPFQAALGATTNTDFGMDITLTTVPPYLNNGVLSLGALSSPVTLPGNGFAMGLSAPGIAAQVSSAGQLSTLQIGP
jgi:hypothetical protein